MKRYLILAIFIVLISSCGNKLDLPQETAPDAAVTAAFVHLDKNLIDFAEIVSGSEHNVADFKVIGAKKLELDNTDEASGKLEQWCIMVDYIRLNTIEDVTFNSMAIYLVTLKEVGWLAHLTEHRSNTSNYIKAVQEHWNYYCAE